MPSTQIQWFPGHMAKTRRLISECLPHVDIVIELLDARIPKSSENPDIKWLIGEKPLLTILSKASLADPAITDKWRNHYASRERGCIFADVVTGLGIDSINPAIRETMSAKLGRYEEKGMRGRALKAMVVGIPNVGKSSLINRLAGAKKARVEDRPGVTLEKQWVKTTIGLELLDMPGVLWPKFADKTVGENLAVTGAIRDGILDTAEIATILCGRLKKLYPSLLAERYKLTDTDELFSLPDYELFYAIGRKRGCIMSGGEVNEARCAAMLLDEFRGGAIGRITLERP